MKRTNFSRLLSLLLVLVMAFTLVFMTACGKDDEDKDDNTGGNSINAETGRQEFIDSIGGVSDTYTGAVSDETFETKEDAAEAYVSNEVVGTGKGAVVEATESKGELNATEIEALKLPEEYANPDSVEKLEVTYSETDYYSALASSSNSTKKVIVYIIKIGNNYKYYSPLPATGETITKSYYESVFDLDNYDNCTYVNESYVKYEYSGVVMEMTLTQTIKRADGNVYFKQEVVGDDDLIAQVLPYGTPRYLEVYIEIDENGKMNTWSKGSDGTWTESDLIYSIDPFAGQTRYNYAFFSKADFGFALKGENALRFYKSYATGVIPDNANLDLYAEYYVKEGILTGMRMEYSAEITQEAYGTSITTVTTGLNKMSCTNYGTTVVERPNVD